MSEGCGFVTVKLPGGFLAALILAGCATPDYGAVRDWAGSAASAAAWQAPAARPTLAVPVAAEASPAARAEPIRAMQAALDAWFTALSTMAADGLVRRL